MAYSDFYSIPACVAPYHHTLYVRLLEDRETRMGFFMEAYGNGVFARIGVNNAMDIAYKWESFLPEIANWIEQVHPDGADFYGLRSEITDDYWQGIGDDDEDWEN